VILVDNKDNPVGIAEKMEAHRKGLLHRAFSIFIFNSKGEVLLQQRALHKYHSGGLWTNACCSHPNPGEETLTAAKRRLKEEMGFETPVEKIFDFVYKTEFDNGLTEHEFDHIYTGEYDDKIEFNINEVMDYCYKDIKHIRISLQTNPEKYTIWFHLAFPMVEEWWRIRYHEKVA
jgi:isopentenyl-diphosphate delta-isomerase